MADIRMPQLGETVTEGTITKWFKQIGEPVREDEVLFEVSTDKVDTEVPSPTGGVVTEILVAEGATVDVGTVIARIGAADAAPVAAASPVAESSVAEAPVTAPPVTAPPVTAPPVTEAPVVASSVAGSAAVPAVTPPIAVPPVAVPPVAAPTRTPPVLSPVVRRLIADHGIDPATIAGTGLGGRITRADVEARVAAQRPSTPSPQQAPVSAAAPAVGTGRAASAPEQAAAPRSASTDVREPLNRIRRLTGEYMVASKATSPHVLTAIEVDYENIERVRRAHRDAWKATEGFSLTYLPFIARALSTALREFPYLNASVGEGELVVHQQTNLAIAVDINFEGLLAPVVHDIDAKRMRAIAREIVDLAGRARSKQLTADNIVGGTFTITNAGQYGTLMQFPVINQPQVAILSTDGVSRKPVVITDEHGNESIGIHSVGVLALAWDHRAFDGAYAAAFLNRLREILETHDWEAELA